jgi:hypothetical protein
MVWTIAILMILMFILGGCAAAVILCNQHLKELDELSKLHKEYRDSCDNIFKLDNKIIDELKKLCDIKDNLIELYETLISKTYVQLVDLRDNQHVDGLDEVIGSLGGVLDDHKEEEEDSCNG